MRGFCCVGLDNPKNAINVGSILRAAGVYSASFVALSGPRPKHYMGHRIPSDPQKQHIHTPVFMGEDLRNYIPFNCVPVAIELLPKAQPLPSYVHPERAFYIFGAEDATLGKRVTDWCRDIVYVPTEYCMNLAATVNVVLYDRLAKQLQTEQ